MDFLESSNLLCFMLPIFLNEFVHWKLNVCLHGLWFWNSKSNMQYNVSIIPMDGFLELHYLNSFISIEVD